VTATMGRRVLLVGYALLILLPLSLWLHGGRVPLRRGDVCACLGSAAFLAPEIGMMPERGLPPMTLIRSMRLLCLSLIHI